MSKTCAVPFYNRLHNGSTGTVVLLLYLFTYKTVWFGSVKTCQYSKYRSSFKRLPQCIMMRLYETILWFSLKILQSTTNIDIVYRTLKVSDLNYPYGDKWNMFWFSFNKKSSICEYITFDRFFKQIWYLLHTNMFIKINFRFFSIQIELMIL